MRRLLIEAAWHHRRRYRIPAGYADPFGRSIPRSKRAAMPATGVCINSCAGFNARKKPPVVANVAIARQLASSCSSLATLT